jgi:hypothetical protein
MQLKFEAVLEHLGPRGAGMDQACHAAEDSHPIARGADVAACREDAALDRHAAYLGLAGMASREDRSG